MIESRGLWRGKHKAYHNYETGEDVFEWVNGYLIKMWGTYHLQDPENENLVYVIDPNTLGACSGVPDRKGNIIFEGDFLRYLDNGNIGLVAWSDRGAGFVCRYQTDYYDTNGLIELRAKRAIIIGNVHDNPELLKGDYNNGSRC